MQPEWTIERAGRADCVLTYAQQKYAGTLLLKTLNELAKKQPSRKVAISRHHPTDAAFLVDREHAND